MEIIRLNNAAYIKEFMTQPELYDRLREDYAVKPESWAPNLVLSIWLMVYETTGENELDIWGMFAFAPETPIVYRMHPAIAPSHWGDKSNLEAGKLAVRWMWEHTSAEKIIGKIPVIYPELLKWGQRLGFNREGMQRRSFLRDGKLHDQYHVGINRE